MTSVVKDPSGPAPVRPSQVAALVMIPVIACAGFAFTAFVAIAMVAFLSAYGHGRLSREEALPLFIGSGLVTLAATAGVIWWVERTILGPAAGRIPAHAALAWRTRAAAVLIIIVTGVGGPPLARAIADWRTTATARHGSGDDRWDTISRLTYSSPSTQARDTLQAIATDVDDEPEYRALAASGLWQYPKTKPVLIALAKDASHEVRAAAGSALVRLAEDASTWALIEELALRDPSLIVREAVAQAVSKQRGDATRSADHQRVLEAIATTGGPGETLAAAEALGGGAGYDAAIAIVMDPNQLRMTRAEAIESLGEIKDPRAVEILVKILKSEMDPAFAAPDMDSTYRAKAAAALANIQSRDEQPLTNAYSNEQWMLPEMKTAVDAQLAYRKATGFFDARLACLELVATCVRGRDRDESLLGPALASLMARRGYARQFHPGPPAPADQIAAAGASATSITAFAYVAVPETPLDTGIRAYCADDTGRACYTRNGSAPAVRGGRCPASVPPPPGFEAIDFYGRPLVMECAPQ
jgi:hypothetical protein